METPIRRFRIEDKLWEAAERIGLEQDRSASWIIRKALEEYIERHRAAKRAAKEAAALLDKPRAK
jgi:predicted transcriptional regulator